MKRFTQLFQQVDATTSTNAKVAALQHYFEQAEPVNAIWAIHLFLGKTRKRLVTSRVLRVIFLQISEIPEWLFEDCYAHVGDSAEVIALLLKDTPLKHQTPLDAPLHEWMEQLIPRVKQVDSEEAQRDLIVSWWGSLQPFEVFVLNKVLTGAFRVGASSKLVIRALAQACGVPEAVLTHRLMGEFEPTPEFYLQLTSPEAAETAPSQPYPFFLAAQIDDAKFAEENMAQWQAEWKWDGIRAQVIKRADEVFIWSRGEDLVTHQFPEIEAYCLANVDNGMVFDGEILCWQPGGDRPMNFNALQKRLGRKRVTKKLQQENPVRLVAYDLLEQAGQDVREKPLSDRRQMLLSLLQTTEGDLITPSECVAFESWDDLVALRGRSRQVGAEGLVIKAINSPYLVGRKRGYWWKYKVDPMSLDAVLIYAQAGSGKRANLFTDYTFALWKGDELVPFAKAYSGLDNAEINKLDKWIRRHTTERFGPVRSVEPLHVFEIGFEGITQSNRHKSGISVRFPRILRWRTDKPTQEADSLDAAFQLLETYQG
ncbi:MAG: ATP-dependent DNA ligase [Cyanobacteria bacterium P01_A01_bin.123]